MSKSSSICRTCMKQGGDLIRVSSPLYTADTKPGADTNIIDALTECTSIQIDDDDGLPQAICSNCLSALRTSYEFRHQALHVYNKLRKQLVETKVKNEISIKSEEDLRGTPDDFTSYSDYECLDLNDLLKQETSYFECKKCFKVYQSENELSKHMTIHKGKREAKVSYDISTTDAVEKDSYRSMPDAMNNSDDSENVLDDDQENKTGLILDASYLLQECTGVQTNENVTKYQCSYCSKEFPKRKSLVNHLKKHEDTSYPCEVCGLLFTQKTLLNRHRKLHSAVKPYKCTKCHKSYSRSDQFNDHMKRHDGVKPKICPYCSKGFAQLCSLKEHIRTHTGETPFLCSQCGKGFNNSSNLRQHMMRHTGVKPYACSLCPKTFCTKGQMNGHMQTHSGAHPYTCSQCGSSFTKPQSLKKHSLIHLGLKPFECDACPMRFADRNHLQRHQRTHTGEKPYQCTHCDRAFAQTNDLVKHLRIHLGKNIYRCSVCGIGFRLQTELRRHYPSHYEAGAAPPEDETEPPSTSEHQPTLETTPNMPMPNIQTKTHEDGRITITFTGDLIDKASFHQGFTIDMMPEKS